MVQHSLTKVKPGNGQGKDEWFYKNHSFTSLFETIPDALLVVNKEGRIEHANKQAESLFRYKRQELKGKEVELLVPHMVSVLPSRHRQNFFNRPRRLKIGSSHKLYGVQKRGKEFPVELVLNPFLFNHRIFSWISIRDIPDRRQMEEELKLTYAYARSLIEASTDPLFTISPEGKITDVNKAAASLNGIPREKLIGTDFSMYFTEPKAAWEGFKEVFEKGFVSDYPLTIKHKKKNLINILFNASIYKDESGNVLGVFAAARDVTAQRQASQYARSLIEASLDPLVTINLEGKITDVNEASVRATGVPREKLIGTDFSDYFTEPQKAREGYKQIFARGFVADYPLTIRNANGKLTDVLYNATVYKDEQGNVLGALATARDITQVKRTSQYARSLIEASLDPLVTFSPEGKITDVNEALVRATGVPREKLIGTDFSDYFTEPEKASEAYQQIFAKGSVADYPLTIRDTKGKLTDVLYNATVYKDDLGYVLGALATSRDITQLKRTSEYARSLIEASLDPIVAINPDGKITDVNEASVKAIGIPRAKLIGTDFSDYFTEPQKAREGYQQVFAEGFVADYPLTLRNIDGRLISVLYNASVYRDGKGDVLGAVAAARDITVLKEAEEKIRKIQAYTRSLIETSLDPQITKGPDGKITDVNEATVQVTGVPREKLIGTQFPDYFTEPDKAEQAYRMAYYEGVVRNFPLAIRHISGKITDVLYNATVFKDEEGGVQGVFASARDITDRKQAEEEIKKQQAYTRSLIEASLDPMVAISPVGKITDVNEALVRATGVKREKLIGTDFSDYFTEPQKAREAYQQVFAKGFVSDYALTISHSMRDVLYNASLYSDEKGTVLGGFATARDITAMRKQEMRIKALNEELEQRIIELESFSYSVSHDLRAPLRGIDGFLAIFLKNYFPKVDEEGQRLLNSVRRNVEKMGSLIDELLTLSRIGMKDIQIVKINMTELANTVMEELEEMKGSAKIEIRNLGFAEGDIALIKQVLVNLCSNAFKYSNKKRNPKIELGAHHDGDEMVYYVNDNGVGFDMEYSNKLFGVFQRLHDPTEYQGTGVGLAIVKRIITRHGGRVWAKGGEGKGATFYFTLNQAN